MRATQENGPVEHNAWLLLACCLGAFACEPVPAAGTGDWTLPSGPCGRGVVVLNSDYASATVNLLAPDGELIAPAVFSSADRNAGLAAALSGDATLSSTPYSAEEIVVIDRETAVLTWISAVDGSLRQLSVATGFFSNPHDYLLREDGSAVVPRFGENLTESEQDFDRGNDVLVIEPRREEILESVDVSSIVADEAEDIRPNADRVVQVGDLLVLSAQSFDRSFTDPADSRLVVLNAESLEILQVLVLPGRVACSSLAVSPSGAQLAVTCSGYYGATEDLERSALVVLDVDLDAVGSAPQYLTERWSVSAAELGGQLGTGVAFADEETLLAVAAGRSDENFVATGQDKLLRIDLSGTCAENPCTSVIHESAPFALGNAVCHVACDTCYVTDADTDGGQLLILKDSSGSLDIADTVPVRDGTGLPPRQVMLF